MSNKERKQNNAMASMKISIENNQSAIMAAMAAKRFAWQRSHQ
jgi:hypothetical protein